MQSPRPHRANRESPHRARVSVYYLWLFNLLLVHDLTTSIPLSRSGGGQGGSAQPARINKWEFTHFARPAEITREWHCVTSFTDGPAALIDSKGVHFFCCCLRLLTRCQLLKLDCLGRACFSNFKIRSVWWYGCRWLKPPNGSWHGRAGGN